MNSNLSNVRLTLFKLSYNLVSKVVQKRLLFSVSFSYFSIALIQPSFLSFTKTIANVLSCEDSPKGLVVGPPLLSSDILPQDLCPP